MCRQHLVDSCKQPKDVSITADNFISSNYAHFSTPQKSDTYASFVQVLKCTSIFAQLLLNIVLCKDVGGMCKLRGKDNFSDQPTHTHTKRKEQERWVLTEEWQVCGFYKWLRRPWYGTTGVVFCSDITQSNRQTSSCTSKRLRAND